MTRALGHRALAEYGVDPTPSGARWGGRQAAWGATRKCLPSGVPHRGQHKPSLACESRRGLLFIPHLPAAPAVTFHELGPQHQALITATDGVWEVLSPAEAVKLVCDCVAQGGSAMAAAGELVSEAVRLASSMRHEGAADNTTASVLLFCEL